MFDYIRIHRGFHKVFFFLLIFVLIINSPLVDAGPKSKKGQTGDSESMSVDHLGLAALMISDGYYERAAAVLSQVDPSLEGLNVARYHHLSGLVSLHNKRYPEAKAHFLEVLMLQPDDKLASISLAQACHGMKDYQGTLDALGQAGEMVQHYAATWTMRVECLWNLGRKAEAFEVLREAVRQFPDESEFNRQYIYYLIELGLYRQAVEDGLGYLSRALLPPSDYLVLGEALRKSGQSKEALVILEAARLQFPENPRILIALGHAWLDNGSERTAATLFEQAAIFDPDYIVEAAEINRRAGNLFRALALNGQVEDQKKKIRQRIGILLEMERYEEIDSLEPRLSRLGMLEDDELRYALAYVKFKTGQYEAARGHLRLIRRTDLFTSVTELMKAMETP